MSTASAPKSICLQAFLDNVYAPAHLGITDGSLYQMSVTIRVFERWAKRPIHTDELSDELVRSFLADYLRSAAPATVNSKRRQILAIWACAYDEGYCAERAGRIRRATEDLDEPEAWSEDEVARILDAAKQTQGAIFSLAAQHWWFSLLLVLYYTGERIGAMLKARNCDLDLLTGQLRIRKGDRKTKRSRWYLLPQDAVASLEPVYSPYREPIWPWPFTREWLDDCFTAILERAKVPFGREHGGLFHKMRRTSGSLVEAAGGDGSRHLGNTRAVFERHYRDPRLCAGSQVHLLPRPTSHDTPMEPGYPV